MDEFYLRNAKIMSALSALMRLQILDRREMKTR